MGTEGGASLVPHTLTGVAGGIMSTAHTLYRALQILLYQKKLE